MAEKLGYQTGAPKGCKECTERHPGCQDTCQKPGKLALDNWHKIRRMAEKAYAAANQAQFESYERNEKRWRK